MPSTQRVSEWAHTGTELGIDVVLQQRLVRPLFQPVVDLRSRTVVGLEALARGPAGSDLEYPDRLFAAAGAAACLAELDMLCIERALECARAASVAPPVLFVNAEPAMMNQPLSPRLLEIVRAGLPFREILEYTERGLSAVPGDLLRVAGQLQQAGAGLAFDDVGVEPLSLAFLPVLEPEVIKLDMSLIRDPHGAHTRRVCAVARSEAERTGAVIIAEGIETEDDLTTAQALGAHWGQGWLFGRPGLIEQAEHRYNQEAAALLRPARPGFHRTADTPFGVAAGHGRPVTGNADAVSAALNRLRQVIRSDRDALIIVSCPDTPIPGVAGWLSELTGGVRSVIMLDQPLAGEFAVTVLAAGSGFAVCMRTPPHDEPDLVVVDDLHYVAAVARALLTRLGGGFELS
jgi:EAL domain-containing protein (putative c-di-GMP-specific phosphodiesterase class I)